MNAARPPEHLIKELVQNSLDSIVAGQPGWIQLSYSHDGTGLHVHCADNGSGIDNLADLRVVVLTHKTDSHQKRGRFGRGFKEAAHAMAMHHSYEFREELERLAGVAASLMLQRGGEIRERFSGLSGAIRQ